MAAMMFEVPKCAICSAQWTAFVGPIYNVHDTILKHDGQCQGVDTMVKRAGGALLLVDISSIPQFGAPRSVPNSMSSLRDLMLSGAIASRRAAPGKRGRWRATSVCHALR